MAAALVQLADTARSDTERERLAYLCGHVRFLVPYAEAWMLARGVHQVLREAAKLDKAAAREKVRSEAVPLWLELAPQVRRAVLEFQRIACTRNDLGTLASMHNKFVRLALVRLRLSIKEYLETLPPEMDRAVADATGPDEMPARLFVPTRPGLLARGDHVRISIVSTGERPVLHARGRGRAGWTSTPARLAGRKTYHAVLGPFAAGPELAEYYVSAGGRTAPPEAPRNSYLVTLI